MKQPTLFFTLSEVEAAFDDLRRLLEAQGGAGASGQKFLLDDVENEIRRLMSQGLTKEQLAEITAAEGGREDPETISAEELQAELLEQTRTDYYGGGL